MTQNRWLLPEGIEEALPVQAQRLESFRRRLLDLYHSWGYELVMPPFIEYVESLLAGMGSDMDLQTFKLTDQLSGRSLGVRADMTPQVARIDAHMLKRDAPARLCYLGTVLHARPEVTGGTRSPLQLGAELYGHSGADSDIEIVGLMLETLRTMSFTSVHLDLGHVGIYRNLALRAGLDATQESALFDMLLRKALPEIREYLQGADIPGEFRDMFLALAELNGGAEVIAQARRTLSGAGPDVEQALDYLETVAQGVKSRAQDIDLCFDLAELRGYHYHTGVVFAAFVPGHGQELARGGRYDDIGKSFGRARPATGFSADLRALLDLSPAKHDVPVHGIFVPQPDDATAQAEIRRLRASGERVICSLSGQQGGAREAGCDRKLVKREQQWIVVEVE
ncbi:MAG: ATP phosphoribosyltransferase regulatory subunit [Gammaproteobacteria bacterium]